MLNNIKNKANQQGFTIVELLIVIVVIAILAAITIVAYNGIQNRAKATSGQQLAAQIAKKAEAWNTVQSSYPSFEQLYTNSQSPTGSGTSATSGGSAGPGEAKLDNPSAIVTSGPSSTTANGGQAVSYATATGGACVGYWDYAAATPAVVKVKVGSATC